MIKGCNKRVVYMKNTGSDMFDEAYFIVRAEAAATDRSEHDMVAEAERIIRESETHSAKGRRQRSLFSYLMGVLSATVFYTVLGIIIFYTH